MEPTIQEVVDTGMPPERIRDVVNGIAKGVRTRANRAADLDPDTTISLARIADALDYLVALSKLTECK
jgi:hypothetical protein